jgi:hypothetical protein
MEHLVVQDYQVQVQLQEQVEHLVQAEHLPHRGQMVLLVLQQQAEQVLHQEVQEQVVHLLLLAQMVK